MATYAAIGTDGVRPVVWGLGMSEDAEHEARRELHCSDASSPITIVAVDADQEARIRAGVVDLTELGIWLTPAQIRELR